jgi:hypothetical protein
MFGIEAKTVFIILGSLIFVSPIFLFSFRLDWLYLVFLTKLDEGYPDLATEFKATFERKGLEFLSGFPIPLRMVVYRPFKLLKFLKNLKAKVRDKELTTVIDSVMHNVKYSLTWFLVIIGTLSFYFLFLIYKLAV